MKIRTNLDPSKEYRLLTDSEINEVNELRFDISFLKRQIEDCEKWLNHGNWSGYSENKKLREERLKCMRQEYCSLIEKLNTYKTT